MKAISLWQPWATLWLLTDPDEKICETRSWWTGFRGPLLVHAAKKRDGEVRDALSDPYFIERLAVHGLKVEDLAFGALVGRVTLEDCRRTWRLEPTERERLAGNWEPGRFAWIRTSDVIRFAQPIPFRGAQGFFDVPENGLTTDCGEAESAQMSLDGEA